MFIKIFNAKYDLAEFNLFINQDDGKTVSVLELLIDCHIEVFEENELELEDIFLVETEELTYVFSNYEVNEFYLDGDFVRVICIK